MKPYERIRAAIHFEKPDRIPIWDISSFKKLLFTCEIVMGSALPPKSWQPGWRESEIGVFPHWEGEDYFPFNWKEPDWVKDPKYEGWKSKQREEIDYWGCFWNRSGEKDNMGHPGRPSLPDWSKLGEYIDTYFLDPTDTSRYKSTLLMHKLLSRKRYKMISLGFGPFTIASMMRGFSPFLIDHKRNPNKVKYLLEQLTGNFVTQMKIYKSLGGNPHGFFLIEDLGEQNGPYFRPKVFKEFYEPVYRTLYETAHQLGADFHQHCCGKIDGIMPDLIDWGLDAIELDSPRMTGYVDLKPFRGKIMFWGCVNIQSIYPRGTPEECEREVWHMMRNLGTKDGGFGVYFYPQPHHILAPQANIDAFKRGIKKYGKYSKIPPHWWDSDLPDKWIRDGEEVVPELPDLRESPVK